MSKRVVSLLPSNTEILFALGLGELLIGRSHECDFPAEVSSIPEVTRSRVDSQKTAGEIDRDLKGILKDALSIFEVDTKLITELDPDVILTQAQCEVCAVSLKEVEEAAESCGLGADIVSVTPKRFADLWDNMFEIAMALDVEEQALPIIKGYKQRCVDIIEKVCMNPDKKSVVCLEWFDPLMTAGNWVPGMVSLAGGEALLCEDGKHSPYIDWDKVTAADPEVIILMPCGFTLERTLADAESLKKQPGWSDLQAVKNGKVYAVDGNSYFNRPGPRLVDSLEILSEILHPTLFERKHGKTDWLEVR